MTIFLINTARGDIVNVDLVQALKNDNIKGAHGVYEKEPEVLMN